jgi:predicted acyltransferase
MTNGWPGSTQIGWSAPTWETLMGISAILTFCEIRPSHAKSEMTKKIIYQINILFRIIGFAGLIFLSFQFIGKHGARIITLTPLHIYTGWWGILGIIGWAYFIASLLYLMLENHRTALLGSMVLLFCLYAAAKNDALSSSFIDIGGTLGTQPAIAVAGMLLATILITPNTSTPSQRIRFTSLFILAMVLGALLLNNHYGISKNQATPSWGLWACAITATLWLFFYFICDLKPIRSISKPLALAGNNVLLAYLLSAIYFSLIINLGMGDCYRSFGQIDVTHAVLRAISVSVIILFCTTMLNQIGFRLKL